MPPATATIGAANAGGGPGRGELTLPLTPDRDGGRRALESVLALAEQSGLGGARLFGHVVGPAPHHADLVHAAAGSIALLVAAAGLEAGAWALAAVLGSSMLRALGVRGIERFLPGRVSWTLLLRPPGPHTRRVLAAPADRERFVPLLPRIVLGALAFGLLALAAGPTLRIAAAGALIVLALGAAWLRRPPRVDPHSPEALAARALVQLSVRAEAAGDDATAVIVSGCASVDGAGVAAVLDWWALDPTVVDLAIVPSLEALPTGMLALGSAGWRVRYLTIDELRSLP